LVELCEELEDKGETVILLFAVGLPVPVSLQCPTKTQIPIFPPVRVTYLGEGEEEEEEEEEE